MRLKVVVLAVMVTHQLGLSTASAELGFSLSASGIYSGSTPIGFGACIISPGDRYQLDFQIKADTPPYLTFKGTQHFAAIKAFRVTISRGSKEIFRYRAKTHKINDPNAPAGHIIRLNKEAGAPVDAYYIFLAGQYNDFCGTSTRQAKTFEFVVQNKKGGQLVSSLGSLIRTPLLKNAEISYLRLSGPIDIFFDQDIRVTSSIDAKARREEEDLDSEYHEYGSLEEKFFSKR